MTYFSAQYHAHVTEDDNKVSLVVQRLCTAQCGGNTNANTNGEWLMLADVKKTTHDHEGIIYSLKGHFGMGTMVEDTVAWLTTRYKKCPKLK